MAKIEHIHPKNMVGDFFVDTTCIDCDTCRTLAPATFSRVDDQSVVYSQPSSYDETYKALEAVLACPTVSIGTKKLWQTKHDIRIGTVAKSFPKRINEDIYYCGYHSEKSFGAASYFIKHPEGNILVDSPRFAGPLVDALHELGGIKYLFLSHIDDVADHAKFRNEFGCERVIHKAEATGELAECEILLDTNEPVELIEDVHLIPTPGHTLGHMVLHFKNTYLFTGDHLAWSARLNHLYAFKNHCWHSWSRQIQSMESLQDYSFELVLPGHGRRCQLSRDEMKLQMNICIDWMKKVA